MPNPDPSPSPDFGGPGADAMELVPIDRERRGWESSERVDAEGARYRQWDFFVDGLRAGGVWTADDSEFYWDLEHDENPFSEDPVPSQPTLRIAQVTVEEALDSLWSTCSNCGSDVTDEDRTRRSVDLDLYGLGVYCAPCAVGGQPVERS